MLRQKFLHCWSGRIHVLLSICSWFNSCMSKSTLKGSDERLTIFCLSNLYWLLEGKYIKSVFNIIGIEY